MALESIGGLNPAVGLGSNYQTTSLPRNPAGKPQVIIVKRPDGKYVMMTQEEFIKYINEMQRKGKPSGGNQAKPEPYELGPEKNGKRVIGVDNVTEPLKPGTSAPDRLSCPPEKLEEYQENIAVDNGVIDDFKQGKRGDCYLLAAIDSIKRTKEGQEVLEKNVRKNKDGSFTVTLPGAVAVRNHYIEMGLEDKCSITGQYTITAEAVEKAKQMSGKSYAYGDIEVIALELAMEAFRAEILETNKALGKKSEKYIAGQLGPMSDVDTLSGGQMYDAVFILTGQKSDLYEAKRAKHKDCKLYKPGEYGYYDENGNPIKQHNVKGIGNKELKSIVEVNHVYDKESDLQRMLDTYKGKEDKFSITVGVKVAQNGPDGSTRAGGGHALTVSKITDEYVELINPWDTSRRERIPRGEFEKMALTLNVAPVNKQHSDKFFEENGLQNKPEETSSPLQKVLSSLYKS